jgi:hypothetical protein
MAKKPPASPFERCLDSAERRIGKVWAALEETREFLNRGDSQGANNAATELEDQSERLTLITRVLPLYSGHPQAAAMMEELILKIFPVEIGFTEEGWFLMRLPSILPKKSKGSAAWLTDPLYPAMNRFWAGKQPVRYPYNVTIIRHIYNRERPERQYRDHDNIELNKVIDIVALYVMVDDSPLRCRHFYCAAPGSVDQTEVYVVPQEEFAAFLLQLDSIPDGGVKLYENRPEYR